jgi:ribosomal protein S18 acetylase RimI-like enzyme
MALRPLRFPNDIEALLRLMPAGFSYPDHPEWAMQPDELQNFFDTMHRIRQVWPLLGVLSYISSEVREMMGGYCWEEDGQIIGIATLSREGRTGNGQIANLMVLPAYRRRGIARALVTACIDHARRRGDQAVVLDVIEANEPARALYAKLGFIPFAHIAELEFDWAHAPAPAAVPPLPHGYQLVTLPANDWRMRFEIDHAVVPVSAKQFQPVERSAYQPSALIGPLMPYLETSGGRKRQFAVMHGGLTVGWASCYARIQPGGLNRINVGLHPSHPMLARWLITSALYQTLAAAPQRRVELLLPSWQPLLIEAAQNVGFAPVTTMLTMGLWLQAAAVYQVRQSVPAGGWPEGQPHEN